MINKGVVLLFNPSGWQKESINLGLAYLASSLIDSGFDTHILDPNRYPYTDKELITRAQQLDPLMIGISIKTATALEGSRLADLLTAACPNAQIVCGGPHMTLCPEDYMRDAHSLTYGIMGEGELAMVELAEALGNGEDPTSIDSLVWRRGTEVVINKWSPPKDLDALPFPNLDVIEGFSWEGFRYPVVTSRGCPFECIYCCVNKLTGSNKWRFRSPESVVHELETIAKTKGTTHFEVWDDNLTLDLKRAKAICRLLIEKKLNLSWYCHNGIRADRIDLELAKLMKQAGCTSVAFGIESGNPKTFDSIKKGEPLSAVVEAVRLVKSVGIDAVGYFIIGLPGDTLERFIETVRFQRALKLHHYVFGMLIPYPHTEMWDIVQNEGTMFCEITETQHFSDDIVPISFELPSFPKKEMVRAFYIAKYFDIFEASNVVRQRKGSKIIYLLTPNSMASLAGMIIAAGSNVQHIVIGAEETEVRSTLAFSQVPPETNIVFEPNFKAEMVDGNSVVVCRNLDIPRILIFGNCGLVLIDPTRPLHQMIQVRRAVRDIPLIPKSVLSSIGVLSNLRYLVETYGIQKFWRALQNQVRLPLLPNQLPRLEKIKDLPSWFKGISLNYLLKKFRSLSETNKGRINRSISYMTLVWESRQFIRTKMRLMTKIESKKEYPYDDYSSYL